MLKVRLNDEVLALINSANHMILLCVVLKIMSYRL
jgi:hypothetical protein